MSKPKPKPRPGESTPAELAFDELFGDHGRAVRVGQNEAATSWSSRPYKKPYKTFRPSQYRPRGASCFFFTNPATKR